MIGSPYSIAIRPKQAAGVGQSLFCGESSQGVATKGTQILDGLSRPFGDGRNSATFP
jgi:hypothetical protein